jgi:thermitase
MAGVAPNALIMPLRVLDASGVGTYSDISAAILYAADNGAQIINLSLAGTQYSQTMADAVNYALGKGVQIIAAAGNASSNVPYYPGAFPGVIAVGSVDPGLARSSFSNYGDYVRVYAPGRDILATTMDGDYQTMSGTSFSAPEVAGLAAMDIAFGIPLNIENNVVFIYPPGSTPKCG